MDIIAAAIPYADKQGFLGWVSLHMDSMDFGWPPQTFSGETKMESIR